MPTGESYKLALGVAVVLSFPSVAGSITVPAVWRKLAVVALMLALATGGWLARLWVPPATLRMNEVAIATEIDARRRAPSESLKTLTVQELHRNGLFAYTAISAPLGLHERIHHVWVHEGQEVDRIALEIDGGRKEGYRAWTHKRNFPPDPSGRWIVKVVTDTGQMIGILRFRITSDTAEPPR